MNIHEKLPESGALFEYALREAVRSALRAHQGSLPVVVEEDCTDGHTVKLRPAIKALQVMPDGTKQYVQLPVIPDVPVKFAGSNTTKHHFTHPIKKGDEGYITCMDRNMDAWVQSGGVQQPVDLRVGSFSDAKFVPGTHSKPNKVPNYSTKTAQVRWGDKAESKVDVSNTGSLMARNDNAVVHVTDDASYVKKGGASATVWTDDRADHQSPKILINC